MRYGQADGRRGIVGVILIIVFAFICALVMATVLVVRTVRVHETGDKRVMIETPAGTVNIRSGRRLDPEAEGVPVYPGATLANKEKGAGALFKWTSKDGKTEKSASIVAADYITQDAPDKVTEFYRARLNSWIFVSKKNDEFKFERTEGRWKRIVAIREQTDGTHIGVASIGGPAGN